MQTTDAQTTGAQSTAECVFLLDVDNTLLDNDRAKAELGAAVERILGPDGQARFWAAYEAVRRDLDVVNYPATLRRLRAEATTGAELARLEEVAGVIRDWPYAHYLYPGSLAAIKALRRRGTVAILSDGDNETQPLKIERSGLRAAVGGTANVLIFVHKETELDNVVRRLPARHYVMVDDKEVILARAKRHLTDRLLTVWVRQGKYALNPALYELPDPDLVIDRIAELPAALEARVG